jgi:hypothetical protein
MISKDTLFAVSLFPYLGFLWFITRSQITQSRLNWILCPLVICGDYDSGGDLCEDSLWGNAG